MLVALTAAAALLPSLLLLWYFRSRDRNPEPGRVVWTTFFLGIAIIPPILLVALPADLFCKRLGSPLAVGFASAFLAAAIPEEVFKYLVVTRYAARHRAFDEPMDGVVYGAVASLGFATLENILYVADNGLGTAVLRALSAVPGHGFTGVIMGYYVGRARFSGDEMHRDRLLRTGLGLAILLHGLYDFPLMALKQYEAQGTLDQMPWFAAGLALFTLSVLVYEGRLARRLVREARADQDRAAAAGGGSFVAAPGDTGTTTAPSRPISIGAIIRLVIGGLLFTFGGLILIGFFATLADKGKVTGTDGIMLGVFFALPVALGFRLFRGGLRDLHGADPGQAPG